MFRHKGICQEWCPGLALETTGRRIELDLVLILRIYLQLHRTQWIFLEIIRQNLLNDLGHEMILKVTQIEEGELDHILGMTSGVMMMVPVIPMMAFHIDDTLTTQIGVAWLGQDREIVYSLDLTERTGDEERDLIQEMLLKDIIDPDLLFLRDQGIRTDTT